MGSNSKDVPQAQAALSVDGTVSGYVTVADSTPFYVGATVYLINGSSRAEMVIVEKGASGLLGLRLSNKEGQYDSGMRPLPAPNYGRSDCSAFTPHASWTIIMPAQFIYDTTRTIM